MNSIRKSTFTKCLITHFSRRRHHHHHICPFTTQHTDTTQPPISPINQTHLTRICTILYQQQTSPPSKLHTHLNSYNFDLTHDFFLQVCNKFPLSWRPVYSFFQYTETLNKFQHTPVSFNKMIDIVGKSKNIDLFWEILHEMGSRKVVNDKTFMIALKTLAMAREMKKCVEFFHLMNNQFGVEYNLDTFNKAIDCLCKAKLVDEAKYIVLKLDCSIKPNGVTYKHLIVGFCKVGNLIEASKVWNLMVDEGFEPNIDVVETMMETFFKTNKNDEAFKLYQMMRTKRMDDLKLSTYKLVINWMCNKGKISQAYVVFDEMREREIKADNSTLASLIYGLLIKSRIREAYKIVESIGNPDISIYHGLIKGLLKLKKANEATQVFREMIKRGCEPIMHTYVMLLQGHLGKRGRKGPDPLVNFDTIFVGGLVKVGKSLEATKYVERVINRGMEVPRFDYNKFLYYFSNEDGVVMFEEMGKKLREVGLFDLADIFVRYGQKMATREKRRTREVVNDITL